MLRLQNILLALAHFDLTLNLEFPHRVTAICGPSGAGKTSLLELIAGLRRPKTGCIELNNTVLSDAKNHLFLKPEQRKIGYVPQDLALFPHLSVEQNIYYGTHNQPTTEAPHIIDVLEIAPLLKRPVTEISGGEQQRVALARALLSGPKLLLLDEPLGSLDPDLKAKVLPHLRRVRDEFQIPMLYVTHDRAEAEAIAQETIVLDRGRFQSRSPSAA